MMRWRLWLSCPRARRGFFRLLCAEGSANWNRDVEYVAPIVIAKEERFFHKTFMDTKGRTAFRLTVPNVVDEVHGRDLIVGFLHLPRRLIANRNQVSYHLSRLEWLRKPFVLFSGLFTAFSFTAVLTRINTKIG